MNIYGVRLLLQVIDQLSDRLQQGRRCLGGGDTTLGWLSRADDPGGFACKIQLSHQTIIQNMPGFPVDPWGSPVLSLKLDT